MKQKLSVFIICEVRTADDVTRKKFEAYKHSLEAQGYRIHLPHVDTNQQVSVYEICLQNMRAILEAEEIHIFFSPTSFGSHFDMGVAFLAYYLDPNKIIKVIENPEVIDEYGQMKIPLFKSFGQMIDEWQTKQWENVVFQKNEKLPSILGAFFVIE